MSSCDFYLLLSRVQIQNANAVSSPLTYGFPAVTGFLGAVHALERKVPAEVNVSFAGALIASHDCRVKRYRPHSFTDYTLNQSRNPIKKDGKTASIIEEGKVDLTVSLVIPVQCEEDDDVDWLNDNNHEFTQWVRETVYQQRMAGGSVFDIAKVTLIPSEKLEELKPQLAPAFILMDAKKELLDITASLQKDNPDATTLDALIDVATLHHIPEIDDKKQVQWSVRNSKHGRGWLVPMPVGYQAISSEFEAGVLENCRSANYPSQFVETLYGLGKWVFPYSLSSLNNAFWRMNTDDTGLYLIDQTYNI